MDQHIISAWLLKAFARHVGPQHLVDVYDKEHDAILEVPVRKFLAETDAHPLTVERDFSKIEANAARAAKVLAKRTKRLPSGLYAFVGEGAQLETQGPAPTKLFEGMQLSLTGQQIPSPSNGDRLALAQFIALMYVRAPKLEAAAMDWGATYNDAAQAALDQLMPGIRVDLAGDVASLRARMLDRVRDVAPLIARSNWWLCRAGPGEAFVLGDYPVGTTISLGFDDKWRAILNDASFVLTFPLSPHIAVVVAPQRIMPYTGIDAPREAAAAINRLTWRSSSRYVVGRETRHLAIASPNDPVARRSTIPVDLDRAGLQQQAVDDVFRIYTEVQWRRRLAPVVAEWTALRSSWPWWDGCRLVFEQMPNDAALSSAIRESSDGGAG